jgi:putative addiction module antidote
MYNQKLYKNGNSVAVTIPKTYLRELNLRDGTQVVVDKVGEDLVISSKKQALSADVDPKFMKMVDEFINDHEDVLTELSQK